MSKVSILFYQQLQAKLSRIFVDKGQTAILRRSSGDRECVVIPTKSTSVDRMNSLTVTEEQIAFFSPALEIPPDQNQDRLVLLDPLTNAEMETYRLVGKPVRIAPGGITLAWSSKIREI